MWRESGRASAARSTSEMKRAAVIRSPRREATVSCGAACAISARGCEAGVRLGAEDIAASSAEMARERADPAEKPHALPLGKHAVAHRVLDHEHRGGEERAQDVGEQRPGGEEAAEVERARQGEERREEDGPRHGDLARVALDLGGERAVNQAREARAQRLAPPEER